MPYYVNQAVKLANWTGTTASPTGGFLNQSGALYDPATITLTYLPPGATSATTVVGVAGGLVKDAVGLYHFNVTPTKDGTLEYAWSSNDGAYATATIEIVQKPL